MIGRTIHLFLLLLVLCVLSSAQTSEVTAQVALEGSGRQNKSGKDLVTVIWLVPVDRSTAPAPQPRSGVQLVQKGKRFEPHVLVVPVGTAVEFPNRDPFFHNVFSLFEGKRFDLGLYEAGSSRAVHFDRVGISYIFCNIHSQMSAAVIALDTPYYATAGGDGSIVIENVQPGRYKLNVWHEASSPETLSSLSRVVSVMPGSTSLGRITVVQDQPILAHKNKYGRDYDQPAVPAYEQR